MQYRTVFGILALSTLLVAPRAHADPAAAANKAKKLDLAFISSDCFLAVVVHPDRILKRKRAAADVTKPFLAMIQKEIGVNPANLTQLVMAFGLRADGRLDDDEMAVVFRGTKPLDRDALTARLRATESMKVQGKTIKVRPNSQRGPAVYFPDQRTCVVTERSRIEKVLAAAPGGQPAKSALLDLLKKVDNSHDAVFVLDVDAVRKSLLEQFEKDPTPGPHKAFGPGILNNARSLVATARLNADEPIQAVLRTTKGDKAPKELATATQQILRFVSFAWKNERASMLARAERFPLAKTGVEVIDKVLKGAQVKQDGQSVRLSVKAKGGIPDMADVFLGWFLLDQPDRAVPGDLRPPPPAQRLRVRN